MADNSVASQNGSVAKTTRWYSDLSKCSQPGGKDKTGYILVERRDKVFPPEGEDKGGTQVYGLWKTPKGRGFLVCTMITDDKGEQILKTRDLAVGKAKLAELVPDVVPTEVKEISLETAITDNPGIEIAKEEAPVEGASETPAEETIDEQSPKA